MEQPALKTYGELRAADFAHNDIWICAYGIDEDEPWYRNVDEVTYRPYDGNQDTTGQLQKAADVLVSIIFELANGRVFSGFGSTPRNGSGSEISVTQPALFLRDGTQIAFWTTSNALNYDKPRLYDEVNGDGSVIFPIRIRSNCRLAELRFEGTIEGFAMQSADKRRLILKQ